MKLGISSIAWTQEQEGEVIRLLRKQGINQVELAPTKYWPDLSKVTLTQANEVRNFWVDQGFKITSFQALLFGKPELRIFGDQDSRIQTLNYLTKVIELAQAMGAEHLVFGSPVNRQRGSMPMNQAQEIATQFFSDLAKAAQDASVCFCIEPNPAQYGCDFINTTQEGFDFVKKVNHPGFGLHLDTGAMEMNDEDIQSTIQTCGSKVHSVHFSRSQLAPVVFSNGGLIDQVIRELNSIRYQGTVNIEMKNSGADSLIQIEKSLNSFAGKL